MLDITDAEELISNGSQEMPILDHMGKKPLEFLITK